MCRPCPLTASCCPGRSRRQVNLTEHEDLLIAARQALADPDTAEHLRRTRRFPDDPEMWVSAETIRSLPSHTRAGEHRHHLDKLCQNLARQRRGRRRRYRNWLAEPGDRTAISEVEERLGLDRGRGRGWNRGAGLER